MLARRRKLVVWIVLLGLWAASQTGCVRRRMTIRSNPPGALCYVDNYEVGVTPCSTSFLYYGTREIRLVKDGYETLTVMQPFSPPWYQIPPLDFFSENINPQEIRDERALTYTLSPQIVVPTEQLLDRAEQLRRGALPPTPGVVLPVAPGVLPPPSADPAFAPPPLRSGPQTLPPGGQPIQ